MNDIIDAIISQNCSKQLEWFRRFVDSIHKDEWIIVIGHHRAEQIDNMDFQKVLDNHKINLYINGHVHSLEHYNINGLNKYITSSSGCIVYPPFVHHKKKIWHVDYSGFTGHNLFGNILITIL